MVLIKQKYYRKHTLRCKSHEVFDFYRGPIHFVKHKNHNFQLKKNISMSFSFTFTYFYKIINYNNIKIIEDLSDKIMILLR